MKDNKLIFELNEVENAMQRMIRAVRRGDKQGAREHGKAASDHAKLAKPHLDKFLAQSDCDG